MYQFVLWGYGTRGKNFLKICPIKYIKAIIDENSDLWEKYYDTVPIISYEQYKKFYRKHDIVISVAKYEFLVSQLKDDGITNYFLLDEVPYEFRGYEKGRWFDKLPINIFPEKKYIIYGWNIYSILLRDYLKEKTELDIDIIPETEEITSILNKYEGQIKDIVLLWASSTLKIELKQCFVQDVYNFVGKIQEYYMPALSKYRNIHRGKKCFIVATGPSLATEDLDRLSNSEYICFGVNRIYLAFQNTRWRPKYLVASDTRILSSYHDEIVNSDVEKVFINDSIEKLQELYKNEEKVSIFHKHVLKDYNGFPLFSSDITQCVYGGGTVVYDCIQLAVYMGFEEIYLLGTDHNYVNQQTDTENHFHANYYNGKIHPSNYDKELVECAYKTAKKYTDAHNVKIYNGTRGGKLEIFERVNFDGLFN